MSNWEVRHGDCRDVMRSLPPESVDAIVSDPPYGLSFMGKEWDHGVPGVEFWTEALRVAKPGAHLVAFGGTRTYHRLAVAIEDAGWEVRDCLSWLYGSGFPKSHNLDNEHKGWGTALKPAWEPIILARKPLTGTVAANVTQYGTGAINVDGCRIAFASDADEAESKTKNRHGDFDSKPSNHGIYSPDNRTGAEKGNYDPPGRWPANVCLDEDAAAVLDAQTSQSKSVRSKRGGFSNSKVYGIFREATKYECGYDDTGGASRFFFVAREGQCDNANIVGPSLSQPSGHNGSAPSDAVTADNREEVPHDPYQRGQDCTADCTTCTPRQSLASSVEAKDSTDTIPTTPTFYGLCGSALRVTADSISQVGVEAAEDVSDPVSGTRFLYTAKVSRREREAGLDGMPEKASGVMQDDGYKWTHDGKGNAINLNTKAANHHPTVKPIALMRWLCRLVTPPGGLILDPFNGSGSTGCAAVLEGFRYLGAELEPEYVEIARRRIAYWEAQRAEPDLFG